MRPRSLRTRIAVSVFSYSLILGATILALGNAFNERVEQLVWESLLTAELDHLLQHPKGSGSHVLVESGTLRAYRSGPDDASEPGIPHALRELKPGLHDEIAIGEHEFAVLVRRVAEDTFYMTIDITELEESEESAAGLLIAGSLALTGVLALAAWWLSGHLTRPVSRLVGRINELRPDEMGSRVDSPEELDDELTRIVGALNRMLERTDGYLTRERAFLGMASHELRTPIAVISGAVTIAQQHPELPEGPRRALLRVQRATRDMEQLVRMLLVLAKSPDLVRQAASEVDLVSLVQDVVEDHIHLTEQKALCVVAGTLCPSMIMAPMQLVQIAVSNLLRNAIEQSDAGTVTLSIQYPGVVVIEDPGHGLSPEEVSRIYASMARQRSERFSRGLGMELIGRICDHLGWRLTVESESGKGTKMTLDLRSALMEIPEVS